MALTAATYARGRPARAARRARGRGARAALRRHGVADRPARARCASPPPAGATAAPRAGSPSTSRSPAGWPTAATTARDFTLERARWPRKRDDGRRRPPRRARSRGTIGRVLDAIAPLARAGLVDEVLVVDAASARRHRARSRPRAAPASRTSRTLLPELRPRARQGRRDVARARRHHAATIVAFLDADTEDFHAGFVLGLLGPLLDARRRLAFVKGAVPAARCASATPSIADGGGRVTELVARPLLEPPPAGAGRLLAAARGRGRRAPRAARAAAVPGRLRRRDRDADRRAARGRARRGWRRSTSARARTATSRCARSSAMALAVLAAAERRVHGAGGRSGRPRPAARPRATASWSALGRARRASAARTGGRGAARLGLIRAYARRRAFNSASCTWRLPEVIASRTRRS